MSETGPVHVLASRDGIHLVLTLLAGMGAMCPKCGFGTRVTSKRWAKCKRCGERVRRRSAEEVEAAVDAKLAERRTLTPNAAVPLSVSETPLEGDMALRGRD